MQKVYIFFNNTIHFNLWQQQKYNYKKYDYYYKHYVFDVDEQWTIIYYLIYFPRSGHSEVVPEKNRRSTDSDEEFCDSMEHLAMEEVRCPFSIACTTLNNYFYHFRKCAYSLSLQNLDDQNQWAHLSVPRLNTWLQEIIVKWKQSEVIVQYKKTEKCIYKDA